MLEVDHLVNGYGQSQVLHEVSFKLAPGEIVGMLGRNGMGKTTCLRGVAGLTPAWSGEIVLDGQHITSRRPDQIAKAGLTLVPEDRRIFATLTVRENLEAAQLPARSDSRAWDVQAVFELFPRLAERQKNMGNELSGGEQQMLTIGRGLMTNPIYLLLDEAFEGLAPNVRSEIWTAVRELGAAGQSILLVDSQADRVAEFADQILILELGRLVWEGPAADFQANSTELKDSFLTV